MGLTSCDNYCKLFRMRDGTQKRMPTIGLLALSTSGRSTNRADEAYKRLQQSIITGELRPNQRLVESQVARKYKMSRTPVHEALIRLEATGYVTILETGGAIVTDHSPTQLRNLYEFREALETKAMSLACQRATPEQIERAAKYHTRSFEAVSNRDLDKFIELNDAFHGELAAACGNEQLSSLLQTLRDQSFDRRVVRLSTNRELRAMLRHHEQILEGVRRGNARLAEKAVREHLRVVLRVALERL